MAVVAPFLGICSAATGPPLAAVMRTVNRQGLVTARHAAELAAEVSLARVTVSLLPGRRRGVLLLINRTAGKTAFLHCNLLSRLEFGLRLFLPDRSRCTS